MKSFFTKLGKVVAILKQEGIIAGSKRLRRYFKTTLKLFLLSGKGDVLIITGGVGDSSHYRAQNQADELNRHQIKTQVVLQENLHLMRLVNNFQMFIFRRTLETKKTKKIIEKIKAQKKTIIFETDDLVFDLKFIQNTERYKNMVILEKIEYQKGLGAEILLDPYVKTCVTSTSYLAKILETYGKKVFISKNKISQDEVANAQKLTKNNPKTLATEIKIGYFSGTNSHDKDFAEIFDVILVILKKYPQVKLVLGGTLKISEKLERYSARILRLPLVARKEYYANLYQADINLAPLVLGDPFCEAKSEIKFLESAILGIPTVAIRNQTFSESIIDGVDGFLAQNKKEWQEKLEKLIENPDLRKTMGENARKKVLRDSTTKNSHNEDYYAYLREQIKVK